MTTIDGVHIADGVSLGAPHDSLNPTKLDTTGFTLKYVPEWQETLKNSRKYVLKIYVNIVNSNQMLNLILSLLPLDSS